MLGIAVSLVLIAVSGTLNFRFVYRMADTELDGILYGLGVAGADVIKALTPFVMAWAWRRQNWLTVASALVYFTAATAYSLSLATGYAAQHRAVKELASGDQRQTRSNSQDELERVKSSLAHLGVQRSVAEVERAMVAVLHRPVGNGTRTVDQISNGCTLNRIESRASCAELAALAQELERSREVSRLELEARRLSSLLAMPSDVQPGAQAQVDVLTSVGKSLNAGVKRKHVEAALAFGFALLIELGSGLGLYLVTTPWRLATVDEKEKVMRERGRDAIKEAERLGEVDEFMAQSIVFSEGRQLSEGELFDRYLGWCKVHGRIPMKRSVFSGVAMPFAAAVGIPYKGASGRGVYVDVAFKSDVSKL